MEILKITFREQGNMVDYFREQGNIVSRREGPKNALKITDWSKIGDLKFKEK